jgi:nicotinic acid mononucleotide adenylyltransferase
MRIAVLFGSFNPMTNAHVGAMKTAVKAINADKGLFVATNGKYLIPRRLSFPPQRRSP